MEKSINKIWKESGSTLNFKDWLDRENKKKEGENLLSFDSTEVSNSVKESINTEISNSEDQYQPQGNKKFLGLDTPIIVFSTLLIVGSVVVYFIKKRKGK